MKLASPQPKSTSFPPLLPAQGLLQQAARSFPGAGGACSGTRTAGKDDAPCGATFPSDNHPANRALRFARRRSISLPINTILQAAHCDDLPSIALDQRTPLQRSAERAFAHARRPLHRESLCEAAALHVRLSHSRFYHWTRSASMYDGGSPRVPAQALRGCHVYKLHAHHFKGEITWLKKKSGDHPRTSGGTSERRSFAGISSHHRLRGVFAGAQGRGVYEYRRPACNCMPSRNSIMR